ncbi:MAG TPA: XdhC family protein [Gemmatimonadales bacterium]|jgi:xanthine dehydrogenase accessory factor|nr:XdhC family protein [Gemmatimonadales bacterium]
MNVWIRALELARTGGRGALATIARATGSTPVPAGAKMLIGDTDRLAGSIGGGCVEGDVIRVAFEAQVSGRPSLVTHHLNADLAGDVGLSCGGTVQIFVEPLSGDPGYVAALAAAADAAAGTVTTAIDWTGGPQKSFTPLTALDAQGPGASISDDRRFVVERLVPAPRLLVFGAGHVGAAIARAAAAAGFRVTVTDDRPEFADAAHFPGLEVRALPPERVVDEFAPGPADAVVVATRGHKSDAEILDRLARMTVGYVGLLGSARKRAVILKALGAAGAPAEALAAVRVPVGLEIGAVTPEEIAVSVTAELIAWRRLGPRV